VVLLYSKCPASRVRVQDSHVIMLVEAVSLVNKAISAQHQASNPVTQEQDRTLYTRKTLYDTDVTFTAAKHIVSAGSTSILPAWGSGLNIPSRGASSCPSNIANENTNNCNTTVQRGGAITRQQPRCLPLVSPMLQLPSFSCWASLAQPSLPA